MPAVEPRESVVFVDELFVCEARESQARRVGARNGHQWCHMWSEDVEALHEMAARIGMKRAWFQDKPGFPHYDLVPSRRSAAIELGAVVRPLRDFIRERRTRSASPSASTLSPR